MKHRKMIYLIIGIIVVVIGIVITLVFTNKTNIKNSEPTNTSNINRDEIFLSKYSQASNEIVATIYGQDITEKDLALYEAYSDEGNALDNVIEHKIITKKAKENNIILNENDIKSMQQYKEDLEKSNIYETEIFKISGLTKEQFIAIKLELYEHILIASNYENEILEKLREGTFETDNRTINNKISKLNKLYDKWSNEWKQGKTSNEDAEDIYNLQEEIVDEYLQYIVEQERLAKQF